MIMYYEKHIDSFRSYNTHFYPKVKRRTYDNRMNHIEFLS